MNSWGNWGGIWLGRHENREKRNRYFAHENQDFGPTLV